MAESADHPPPGTPRRRWPHIGAIVLVVVAAGLTLGPLPISLLDLGTEWSQRVSRSLGFSDGSTPRRVHVEMAMNVLLPAVLVVAFVLARPRTSLQRIVGVGVLCSVVVETAQILIPGRNPDPRDLLLNSLGVLTGAAVGWVIRHRQAG